LPGKESPVVEAGFWYHPLVWWLGARLVDERERACDEEVLRMGSDPQAYAEAILQVCEFYLQAPLACVSGVSGADLKKRIEAIMKRGIAQKLDFGKRLLLATVAMAAVAGPVVVGLLSAPQIRAQSPAAAGTHAEFEVASIKPCSSDFHPPPGARGGGGFFDTSPGRVSFQCMSVAEIITRAYGQFGDPPPLNHPIDSKMITGGPAWVYSDRYTIEAKAEGAPATTTMMGAMLRALLEDRFQLKIHQEVKEVPAYALTVAKSGFKLQPVKEGSCTPPDPIGPNRVPASGEKPLCVGHVGINGPNVTFDSTGLSLAQASRTLGAFVLGRPVIDKTGITKLFSFHVEFAGDEITAMRQRPGALPAPQAEPSDVPPGPSVFAVFEKQLGLKLVPTKGPEGFLVIDHVERPSKN
jgi:uncharacterized protein (TIGR03435 family)